MNRLTTKISRREALGLMGGAAIATQVSGFASAADAPKPKSTKGIALQLFTLRDAAKVDLPGTLKKVRDIGYEYVQWSGMPDLPADQIRAALDKAGLQAIAAHVSIEPFEKDFDKEVKYWKTVGVHDIAPGGMMKDCDGSHDAWLKGAARLDALGAKLKEQGIRLSYHNHNREFAKFPGDDICKLDLLYANTKPEHLCAEFDLAWIYNGHADPAAYVRKYPKRCPVVHAKDPAPNGKEGDFKFMPLGKGVLNWKDIFAAGKESGIEWYVYEQDNSDHDIFDCAKESFEFLSKNLLT